VENNGERPFNEAVKQEQYGKGQKAGKGLRGGGGGRRLSKPFGRDTNTEKAARGHYWPSAGQGG